MTIYERLFGTPERAARTIREIGPNIDQIDMCGIMDVFIDDDMVFGDDPRKCAKCIYECDRYGCERKDITIAEWLAQEVRE